MKLMFVSSLATLSKKKDSLILISTCLFEGSGNTKNGRFNCVDILLNFSVYEQWMLTTKIFDFVYNKLFKREVKL